MYFNFYFECLCNWYDFYFECLCNLYILSYSVFAARFNTSMV